MYESIEQFLLTHFQNLGQIIWDGSITLSLILEEYNTSGKLPLTGKNVLELGAGISGIPSQVYISILEYTLRDH